MNGRTDTSGQATPARAAYRADATAARGCTVCSGWGTLNGLVDWAGLPANVEYEGNHLGRWVREQRGAWPELTGEQRDLLGAIGITPRPRKTTGPSHPTYPRPANLTAAQTT